MCWFTVIVLAGSEFSTGFDLFPCCSGFAKVEAVI